MTKKEFTDYLFKIMYELGYRKAEIVKGRILFYKKDTLMGVWVPRIPVECTSFTDEQRYIDIGGYIGIVDWSKVPVDTPIIVSNNGNDWHKRYFALFDRGDVLAWECGTTSWSVDNANNDVCRWKYAKLAEV